MRPNPGYFTDLLGTKKMAKSETNKKAKIFGDTPLQLPS